MQMKKIIAGIVAGCLTVTSVAVTNIAVNAASKTEVIVEDSGTGEFTANEYGSLEIKTYSTGDYEFAAADEVTATVTAPEGVDTSGWAVAFCGFDTSWGGWQSVSSSAGKLSLTSTIGSIMEANDIEDITSFGGFSLQVWHAGEEGDKVTVSYELTVTHSDTPTEYEAFVEDSGTGEFTANEYGSLEIKTYSTGDYEFAVSDLVTATVTAPEGVDASGWAVAFCGFTVSWGGWQSVSSREGKLSLTSTIGSIMEANDIEDIADLGGFSLQVWHVGEEGDKVTVSYELTVSRAKETEPEEPVETVVIIEDSGTDKECTANEYGSIELSQYATKVYAYPGTYKFAADDVITATVTVPDGVDTSKWAVAFCGLGTWQSVNSNQGKLSLTSTIGKIMKANDVEDVADFCGFALQVWNVGKEGDKVTVSYELTVSRVKTPAENISLNKTTLTLEKGKTDTLEATVDPANSTDKVVWSSDDEDVATVDENGEVTAIGGGTATITATAGTASATCEVTVTVSATGVTLNKTTLTLEKGKTDTLKATVAPTDNTDEVVWSSSDEDVATVDESGKVTAIGGGKAIITAKAGDKSATCEVTVTVSATGVKLDKTTLTLEKGKTDTLKVTVAPTDSTDKVVWSSSDEDVATVDENGKVTAVGGGKAVITAKAGSVSATCEVTVTVPVTSVTLDKNELSLKKGETAALTATVIPADATNKTVTWESDNEDVATVDENGKVTAIASGTAVITASAGGKTAECTVTVTNPAEKIEIDDITVLTGNEKEIVIKITPTDADSIGTVTYKSADETVAKVVGGKVQGVKAGTTTITATAGKLTAEFKVTVTDEEKPATEITLDKTSLSLEKGKSDTLAATVEPNDSTDNVVWSSDNEDVATVDQSGKVTAIGGGTAVITATAGSVSATCEVTVTVPVTSVTLDKNELSLEKDESAVLTATVNPDDATDKTVTWESDNEDVATVDENGKVTAVGGGTATITAKAGNKSATCEVTVTVPVTSVALDKNELSLEKGESAVLTASVNPDDATDKTVTWESSDETVATVDENGKVTAVGGGTATITAKAGSVSATCEVTVTVPVTSVTLDKNELSLEKGESAVLTAAVNPDDATDKTVTWESSDETVATVDENGKVTAVAKGTATITVAAGKASASCEVTVTETIPVESVTLSSGMQSPSEISLEVGETATLIAIVKPDDATDKTVTWTSSDETVATVVDGKITAVAAGTATITATSNADGTKKSSCTVKVTEPEVTEPDITEPDVTEPDVTEPDVTEPDVTEPDVTEPDVTTPEEPAITEGSASGETEVKNDTEIKIEIPELNVTLEAKAETFEEAVSKIIAEVEIKLANASDEEKATVIAAAIKSLANASDAVSVNEVISVTLKDQDGNTVQPVDGASVKVTLPYDGKSNYVAYIGEDAVEFIKLTIADGFASFEAKHFSDYYLVSLSDEAVKAVEGEDTSTDTTATDPSTSDDPKGDENNKPTGIAIALVPAVAAAAASIIFKKRK